MMKSQYYAQILEMIEANGWLGKFTLSLSEDSEDQTSVRIHVYLSEQHPVAPSELINIYEEGVHSLEQIQQECLRALRTGRSGV